MMTPNVKTQAINLFSNPKSGKSSAVKHKNSDYDFGNVMDSNLKNQGTSVKESNTVHETESSSNSNQKTDDNTKAPEIKDKDVNAAKTVKDNTDTVSKDNSTVKSDNQKEEGIKTETFDLSNINDIIQNLLAQIQNNVQSSLGITKEEMEKAMESLGLSTVDLLNPDNLKQLVLQVNGTDDITKALTDENLANTMNQLIQKVDELKSGQNITMSQEEIARIVKEFQGTDLNETQNVPVKTVPEISDKDLNSVNNTSVDKHNDITIEVHKTQDTETKGQDSSADDSNKNEADVKTPSPVELFAQNLAVKGNETNLNFTEQIANVRQMQDITNQIVDQIKIMIKPDQTSMELQLNPENLGKINLSVVAKDGIMTAHFTAQNELAKEAIESQMQVLKDNLNNQGLKVESIEVTVSNFSFEQSNHASGENEKGQQNRSRNRNINAVETEINSVSNEENQDAELTNQSSSSIDYTA